MGWLSEAYAAMMAVLWPGSVTPNSFTRVARLLEAGPDHLHEWRVSTARAGAEMALGFAMSWHPDLALDALMGQRAGAENQLRAKAGRIAAQASYITGFAIHNELQPERTEDGGVMPADDFGLLLDDPEGSSEETGIYDDVDADEEGTGTSANPEHTEGEPAAARPSAGDA